MAATGPPDGGYGWVILAVASLCMSLVVSITRIGGMVFYVVIEEFKCSRTEASLMLVLARMCAFSAAPIAGKMLTKLSYRTVFAMGGFMASLGLILTSQATALWQVIITYGIFLGFGLGLLLCASILIIGMYFRKRRSFAIGIFYTCGGVGSLVMPIIYGYLLEKYWLHGSLLILGAVLLHPCALSMLIVQPTWVTTQTSKTDTAEKETTVPLVKYAPANNGLSVNIVHAQANGNKTREQFVPANGHTNDDSKPEETNIMLTEKNPAIVEQPNRKLSRSTSIYKEVASSVVGIKNDFAIFKDLKFVLQLISRVGCTTALLTMIGYLPDYMKHEFVVPMNDKDVAYVLAMAAIGDTLARFTVGSMLDKLPWSKKYTVCFLCIVIGFILFFLQEAKTMDTLLGCVIVYGLFSGSYIVSLMALEAELMSPKKLPIAHGISQFFVGVLSMLVGILIGYIRDSQGSYKIGIYLLATCALLGGLVWLVEPILIRCTNTTHEDTSKEEQSVVLNANVESVA